MCQRLLILGSLVLPLNFTLDLYNVDRYILVIKYGFPNFQIINDWKKFHAILLHLIVQIISKHWNFHCELQFLSINFFRNHIWYFIKFDNNTYTIHERQNQHASVKIIFFLHLNSLAPRIKFSNFYKSEFQIFQVHFLNNVTIYIRKYRLAIIKCAMKYGSKVMSNNFLIHHPSMYTKKINTLQWCKKYKNFKIFNILELCVWKLMIFWGNKVIF